MPTILPGHRAFTVSASIDNHLQAPTILWKTIHCLYIQSQTTWKNYKVFVGIQKNITIQDGHHLNRMTRPWAYVCIYIYNDKKIPMVILVEWKLTMMILGILWKNIHNLACNFFLLKLISFAMVMKHQGEGGGRGFDS